MGSKRSPFLAGSGPPAGTRFGPFFGSPGTRPGAAPGAPQRGDFCLPAGGRNSGPGAEISPRGRPRPGAAPGPPFRRSRAAPWGGGSGGSDLGRVARPRASHLRSGSPAGHRRSDTCCRRTGCLRRRMQGRTRLGASGGGGKVGPDWVRVVYATGVASPLWFLSESPSLRHMLRLDAGQSDIRPRGLRPLVGCRSLIHVCHGRRISALVPLRVTVAPTHQRHARLALCTSPVVADYLQLSVDLGATEVSSQPGSPPAGGAA